MWKDKNAKLEAAFERDNETRKNQLERIKQLEEKNRDYQTQLQQLKEQKAKQMNSLGPEETNNHLPPIQSEEERQQLKQQLEEEYIKQRAEVKKVEGKTKVLQQQAEDLKATLKEKETMLRIAKFKLSELQRNIKHS